MIARDFIQSCFVVPDLDAAMARWLKVSNVGPFMVMAHVEPTNGLYRGKPAYLEMSCAFAQAGPMQIELIEQHSDGPSAYRDVFAPGDGGFHHFCYWSDGTIADEIAYYRSHGIDAAYTASFGELNFAYFDARETMGCFIEVLEREPGTVALFDAIADAARDWDGKDPVRYVT